ncbi:unnamed protein product [Musa acuminata subsp. malaccensis]|uniref:(wild Malaysian banana) hypothetical protein n=1 Tax=Musa acuminata subsp. malaccensis TaxID=214687 RepID=A0A804J564_MUSAM|nr:unnamed protein product [Musa acuminata subsp. malaccensis]
MFLLGACCFLPHLRPPLPPPSTKRASTKSTAAPTLSQTGSATRLHYLLFLWRMAIAATDRAVKSLRSLYYDGRDGIFGVFLEFLIDSKQRKFR